MTFQGDSTVNRLSREITKQCDNTNYDKKNATTSIVFFNEMTLHYLYLPYARETDIKMKNGPANFLVHNLTSVKDFLNTLESAVEEVIASQKSYSRSMIIYMPANDLCPDKFYGEYSQAWRFLLETLDMDEMQKIARRRHTDITAAIGFTLDHYGSTFARELAQSYIRLRFPQILHFPTTETYPAGCNFVPPPHGDGRHFSRNEHYLIKARLILNLAKSYARAARGTGGTFGVAYEQ